MPEEAVTPLGTGGLVGQETDKARTAVRLQRDIKRKKDGLRKMETKLKKIGNDAEKEDLMNEMAILVAEIAALEAGLANETVTSETMQPSVDSVQSTAARNLNTGVRPSLMKTPTEGKDFPTYASPSPLMPGASTSTDTATATQRSTAQDSVLSEEEARKALAEMVKRKIEESTHKATTPMVAIDFESDTVHYQVAELAHMMESMMVVGGNARTFSMIQAFRVLLQTTPLLSKSSLRDISPKDFERLINANFEFLRRSRVPSAGMTYVKDFLVKTVGVVLSGGPSGSKFCDEPQNPASSSEATDYLQLGSAYPFQSKRESSKSGPSPRETVLNILGGIEEELQLCIKSIVEDRSLPYVSSNDTILVFGRSSTVEQILLSVANNPRLAVKPKVIVVDAAPLYEGRALSKRLTASGLCVTYGLITACCTLLPRCTRVFIGASAVLQNGDVFGRCGTAVVVASAKRYRKPVLCFSESFKFLPEVWLGNLSQNTKLPDVRLSPELRRQSSLPFPSPSRSPEAEGRPWNRSDAWNRGDEYLQQRRGTSAPGYRYDLTPAAYIDMIISEMGCLHTSAIVAALKDRESRFDRLIGDS